VDLGATMPNEALCLHAEDINLSAREILGLSLSCARWNDHSGVELLQLWCINFPEQGL
jgi:hypothetical protein